MMTLVYFLALLGSWALVFAAGRWDGVGNERHRIARLCSSYLLRHPSREVEQILKCVRDPERHTIHD